VLRSLTGANPPKGIDKEAILSAVKAVWSVPHPERIRSVFRGLLYLKDCGYGPAVRYAQSVLEDIEDTDEAEQVFAVVLIQTGQKFDSIEELEHWMKSD
jgi:hypothetical protein